MDRFLVAFVLIFACLLTPVYALDSGETGASFLKMGAGARAAGMGEAYSALADDVFAAFWNPAGLGQINTPEIGFMYNPWFLGIVQGYFGFACPTKIGTMGSSITYLSYGKMQGYDSSGNPTSSFRASDMALVFSYGRESSESLLLGLNLKYISEIIENDSASALAFDVGSLWESPVENLSFGLNVQNIGSKIKFANQKDPLPFNIKAGGGFKPSDSLILGLDLNFPNDSNSYLNLGGEWKRYPVAFRLGYKGLTSSLTYGVGLDFKGVEFDYAFTLYEELRNSYRFSLLIKIF